MSEEIERETFFTDNRDGSISLDAYAGKSREELKERCRELCRVLSDWQMIAMTLMEHGRDGLSTEDSNKLELLIEAYRD